jgi:hypothetical protein
MGTLGLLDRLVGVFKALRFQLGSELQQWGRYARDEPLAAAQALDLVAVELEVRARARKRQDGWVARRLRARAEGFRAHAEDLRSRAYNRPCPRDPLRNLGD